MQKISVIIPTMNEEQSIGKTIVEIKKALKGRPHNIIVVDTNSIDKTVKIAREHGAIVVIEPRRGYGRAYKTGFKHAKGDIIVTLDADSTYPAEKIPHLISFINKNGVDFVSGWRMVSGSMSRKHRFGNWVITTWTNLLFGTKFKDTQSGMWAFRKDLLKKLNLVNTSWPFSGEIKIEACKKGKFFEVPIEYRLREGESKIVSWKVGRENIIFLFKKRFLI